MDDQTQFNSLPPPPQGQTGIDSDQFSHLPPPPKGQTGIDPSQFLQSSGEQGQNPSHWIDLGIQPEKPQQGGLTGFVNKIGNAITGFAQNRFQNLANQAGLGPEDKEAARLQFISSGNKFQGRGQALTPEQQAQVDAYNKKVFGFASGFLNPESGAAGVTSGLEKLAPKLLQGAEENVGRIFQPTTKPLKALTQKIAPEFVEKAPSFLSIGGLLSKAEQKLTSFGQAIGEKFDALPPESKDAIQPILKRITQAQDRLAVKGTDIIPATNQVEHQALSGFKDELVNIAKNTQEIPTNSLRSYLQNLDEFIQKAGKGFGYSPVDSAKLAAQKTMANTIRDEMAKTRPDIAVLNKEYTFWSRVKKIGTATAERKTGQVGGLRGPITGAGFTTAGAGAGAATGIPGGTEIGAVAGNLIGRQFQKIFDSTGYSRLAMEIKKQAADYIISGKADKAMNLLYKSIIRFRAPKQ